MIGSSPALLRVLDVADKVAPSKATVLLVGESGTGKELLAARIHAGSRRLGRFVAVNCAALPRELIESELFGHERGAFTGAVARRPGRFEQAQGGTLLLDEVSELDPVLQAKLLRVLQEREVDRLGGERPVPVDVRVIATSNRDLGAMVDAGTFRVDLYHRLSTVRLRLPALRDRREDIPLLAAHFAELDGVGLTGAAVARLMSHPWPGNIRELRHAIERAALLCSGQTIDAEDLALGDRDDEVPGEQEPYVDHLVGLSLHEVEKRLILATLRLNGWNQTRAAETLGCTPRTIRTKLAEYRAGEVPFEEPGRAASLRERVKGEG